ncbi:MAG: hypothetical protein ACLR56_03225 [Oscillospiraceae bacterium]
MIKANTLLLNKTGGDKNEQTGSIFKRALRCALLRYSRLHVQQLVGCKAKAEGTDFFNRWFSADNDSKWWDGNLYNGLTGPDGDFILTTLTAIGSIITAGAPRAAAPDLTATVPDLRWI